MDLTTVDDQLLLEFIAQRREDALAELYDRYGRLVYSIAVSAVGDPGAAEEITQEVFVQAWENAAVYDHNRGRVATWLSTITRYRAIDRLRRRSARNRGQQLPWAEVDEVDLADNSVDVEHAVALRLQQQRVRAAIRTLPEEQQRVLALAFFQGYTHSEIANLLALPLGTVKTRIRLAMTKLRQLLTDT